MPKKAVIKNAAGEFEEVEVEDVPEVDSANKTPALTVAPAPDAKNRLTYTIAIEIPGAVLAADDFDDLSGELRQFRAEEMEAVDAINAAGRKQAEARKAIAEAQKQAKARREGNPDADISDLVTTANENTQIAMAALAEISAGQAAQAGVWKKWALLKVKGVKNGRHFEPVDPAAFLRTTRAYKAVVRALAAGAEVGESEADFLS